MCDDNRHWYSVVGPIVGMVVMLAGLALLVFRHDDVQGYSFLSIGAVIFGTTGSSRRRSNRDGVR